MSSSSCKDTPDVGPKRALAPDMPISPVFEDNNFVKDEPDPVNWNLFPNDVHDSAGDSNQSTHDPSSSSERLPDRPVSIDPDGAHHPDSEPSDRPPKR